MFKILIVDDECIILNGLKMMLQTCRQLDFPLDIVTASNVPSALEILSCFQPDLLLVDITMPVMNGFDLIRHIRQQSMAMDIIILTSHASFDYARDAVRLQITDYLLKPIHTESLIQAVLASREKKLQRDIAAQSSTLLSLRAMMLYDIPHGDLMLDEARIQALFPHTYFTVVVLAFLEMPTAQMADAAESALLSHFDLCRSFLFPDRREVVLICNHRQFSVQSGLLSRSLSNALPNAPYTLGVSISGSAWISLHRLYQNSIQRIFYQQTFFGDTDMAGAALFTYEDCVHIFSDSSPAQMKRDLTAYTQKFISVTSPFPDRETLSRLYASFFCNLTFYLDRHSIHLPSHPAKVSPEELPLPESVQDMETLIQAISSRVLSMKEDLKKQEQDAGTHHVIRHLLQYIKANFQRDLSLMDLADEVHLNPNYLSGLFKKETSQSYLYYLHRERILAAKELLGTTDLTLDQIAARTGYNSSAQLIRIFKKYEHTLPSDYR